jgi:hypothetical protein
MIRIPGLSKSAPKPDPAAFYISVAQFVADIPNYGDFAPARGSRFRGSNAAVQYLFANGGAHLFAPGDSDDAELAAASAQATWGRLTDADLDRPVLSPEPSSLQVMVCTRAIQVGDSMIAVGSLADADSQFVRKYPANWQAAPADGYSA